MLLTTLAVSLFTFRFIVVIILTSMNYSAVVTIKNKDVQGGRWDGIGLCAIPALPSPARSKPHLHCLSIRNTWPVCRRANIGRSRCMWSSNVVSNQRQELQRPCFSRISVRLSDYLNFSSIALSTGASFSTQNAPETVCRSDWARTCSCSETYNAPRSSN